MDLKEQYKIIGHLKAIRKQLNLICEKLEIETLPTIKIDKKQKKYSKKEERDGEEREKEEKMFIQGIGIIK